MCHQSVGLLANVLEGAGIATVVMTMKPEITYHVRTPRALWVRFPLGNTFGEAFRPDQHRKVLLAALKVLTVARGPMEVYEAVYRWRRF